MSESELEVEPVSSPPAGSTGERTGGRVQSGTVYRMQLAMLATRCATLERKLERERTERRRIVDRYEHLLAEREGSGDGRDDDGVLADLRDEIDELLV